MEVNFIPQGSGTLLVNLSHIFSVNVYRSVARIIDKHYLSTTRSLCFFPVTLKCAKDSFSRKTSFIFAKRTFIMAKTIY